MKFGPSPMVRDIETSAPKRRVVIVTVAMLAVLGLLLGRLVELTVIRGDEYRRRADENRLFVRPVRALRGVIVDRQGTALVRNVPSTGMVDLPGDDAGPVEIDEAARYYPFGPEFSHLVGYVGKISDEELSRCKTSETCDIGLGDVVGKTGLEKAYDDVLRGRDGSELVEVDANGKLLRVLGSEPAVNGKNIETMLVRELQDVAFRALNGRAGSVVAVDPVDGSVLALVSSPSFDSNVFSEAESGKPSSRAQVFDSETQTRGAEGREAGSDEDNEFGRQQSALSRQQLLNDTENRPLFNRAVGGEYPPGSVFKLVVAAAGLSEGKLTGETTIKDTGEIKIGDFRYGNWYFDQYGRTEGMLKLPHAITRSNDIFFYKVGEWVGPGLLASWAKRLGLGEKTGIDTTGESDGLVPDPLWKERVIGERWFLGNTYHMAIGQGDVRVTPLQAAVMTASVVTGRRCQPHIVQKTQKALSSRRSENQIVGLSDKEEIIRFTDSLIVGPSGSPSIPSVLKFFQAFATTGSSCEDVDLSDEHRALIIEGMVGACSRGGTGFPFFEWNESGVPALIACKTGTAQHGGEKTKPHAWITIAGPIKKCQMSNVKCQMSEEYEFDAESEKRIVLTVLLEEAGEGSSEAAPVAKEILGEWFSN